MYSLCRIESEFSELESEDSEIVGNLERYLEAILENKI